MKPATRLRWSLWWGPRISDPNAVLLRQLCIAGVFSLSLSVLAIPGMAAASALVVAASVALVLAATITALVIDPTRRRYPVLLAIPFTDLVAVAVLRSTTGGPSSVFGALLILAVISLGIERGIWPIVLTAAGCVFAVGLPLLTAGQAMMPQQWVRVVFTPTVLILTALTVTVLMNQLRSRIGAVRRLSRAQERWLATSRQLTRDAEEQAAMVREGHDQLAAVINGITEQLIVATDAAGRIEIFNPGAERMLSVHSDRMVGQELTAALAPLVEFQPGSRNPTGAEDIDELSGQDAFTRISAPAHRGNPHGGEWSFRRPDSTTGTLEVSVTGRRDPGGRIDGFLFVGTDVSHAREVARQKDEFVSLISHELRTPLSSILGYLELMDDDDEHPLSAEQRQYLGTVERNAHRLLRLVGDLLFTAQVEAGSFTLDRRRVDLGSVVAAAVESARPTASARGVDLRVRQHDGEVLVTGDPVRLGQALDNLLSNALKFTPEGGEVTVELVTDGDQAAVSFRDTGIGIPADEMDRLFSKFFRASTATRQAVAGVGLGLTITRAIAQAHLGSIAVTSVEGEGTTFTVVLPLLVAARTEVAASGPR